MEQQQQEEEEEKENYDSKKTKNQNFCRIFGGIATIVIGYAILQSIFVATPTDWNQFWELVSTDRSYYAFCVDPILLSIFQPIILSRVKGCVPLLSPIDYIPVVGLLVWTFDRDDVVDGA